MNGDAGELASLMRNIETRLGDKLEDLKSEVSGMNGSFTANHAALKDRVIGLEQINIREGWKEWIRVAVVIPIMLLIHKVLTALGIKI